MARRMGLGAVVNYGQTSGPSGAVWRAWAIGILVLLSAPAARAAVPGLPLLALGSGARGAALAEAMSAVLDPEAASTNPAALSARGQRTISLTHSAWIQGMDHDGVSLCAPWGQAVLGASAQLVQVDGLQRRVGPAAEPLGTFGVYDGSAGFTAALVRQGGLRVGAGLRVVRQVIGTETANGVGVDLGLLYPLRHHLVLGAAWRNLGSMGQLVAESTPMPRSLRVGVACSGFSRLLALAEIQRTRGSSVTGHLGAELTVHPHMTLRTGYQTGEERGGSAGFGLALGRWSLDYAYLPFGAGLGEAHRLGIQLNR